MHTVLAGGVGGARYLRGLTAAVEPSKVTAIVNVGDDLDRFGLRICPDLDTITYWLSGLVHPEQQWGRADERFTVAEELGRFGHDGWFMLGDRDLALHVHRTARLHQGAPLSMVTAEVTAAFGVPLRLLPVTDDRVETRIHTRDGRDLHFQEYWVRDRGGAEVARVELAGVSVARPAPGVIESIMDAEVVFLAPSNPVVSLDPILAVTDVREAVHATSAPVVGISPIIAGAVVRGMAHRLLPVLGVDVSALGVARYYADLLDAWIVDRRDEVLVAAVRDEGIACVATETLMDDLAVAAALAGMALELAAP